ncbi:hypothetical protein EV178_001839 [Coemansia sp. RSA 1646]|nr:hypothetical protein EV178_001839 [Coemansia sp. RSA 1646]KAJ2093016.1 hypothetical protein IW138_000730 [Coemansia sp. RSA 986]
MPRKHTGEDIEMDSYRQPLAKATDAVTAVAGTESEGDNAYSNGAVRAGSLALSDGAETSTAFSPLSARESSGWRGGVMDIDDDGDDMERLDSSGMSDKQAQRQYAIGSIFIQRLFRMFRVLLWTKQTPSRVGVCCVLLIGGKLLGEVVYYYAGKQPSEFYKVLGDKDRAAFFPLLLRCFVVVAMAGASKAVLEYIGGRLGVMMRSVLTQYTHRRYMAAQRLYPLVSQGAIDNPDQRIAQDIERFSATAADVLSELLIAPFLVAYYTVKCWSISGFFGPLSVYIYFVLGALVTRLAMPPVVRAVYRQEREEGNLRFSELRICTFAESIAFFGGEARERESADSALGRVVDVQKQLLGKQLWLSLLTQVFSYLGSTVSYVIVAIPIFMGVYDGKSSSELSSIISLNAFVSIYLIYRFTVVIEQAKKLADVAGYTARIVQLWEELDVLDVDAGGADRTQPGPDGKIVLESLTVTTPTGAPLVCNLNIEIAAGESLMITGPNGTGKTSILRTLCGLWPPGKGHVRVPYVNGAPSIFFLPQTPYIVGGSLREQVSYPGQWGNKLQVCSDRELAQLLNAVCLGHLVAEMAIREQNAVGSNASGYDRQRSVQYWLRKLSPGEQQRISIARVLFWAPEFAILDECTSSLDAATEHALYRAMVDAGITLVSVSHRQSLAKYHKRCLTLSQTHPYTLSDL